MGSHFCGSLLSGPEEPHMQDAFKTILPVSHLQPCVLALPPGQEPAHTDACVYLLQGNTYQYNCNLATLTHV
jgi:hypothetical protein